MNEQQTIRFILENSSEPVIKNPVMRAALQEPRTMAQAPLANDLEPGALKDEMLKDFDPSQETHEEYLQRKSLERPFNMAHGGRIGFKKQGFVGSAGSAANYKKAQDTFYNTYGKKAIDKASKEKHGVTFDKLKGENNRGNFKAKFKKEFEKSGTFMSEEDSRKFSRNKRVLREQGIQINLIKETNKPGKFDAAKFAKDNDISMKVLKKQSNLLQKNIYKKRSLIAGTTNDLRSVLDWIPVEDIKTDTALTKLSKSGLTDYIDNRINAKFYDAFARKYVKGSTTELNPTRNLPKYRAIRKNKNEYESLRRLINKKYPSLNFQLDHPLSQKSINALMDGTAEELSRVNVLDQELNQNFKKQLSDKYLESLKATDGKVNLEMKKSVEKIAKDLNINIGSVPDDLNVKGIKRGRGVQSFEKLNIKDEILKSLKNQQGLSANFKSYVKNNPDVFKMANFKDTSKLGTNLTKVTDKHIEGVTKIFKNAGIPCIKGVGGDCTSIGDFQKGFNQLVEEAADGKGSKQAISKLANFTKSMRKLKGAATWTGYGLLAEAGFMLPFAVGDYAGGKSWKRILGNATDYGFGPIFGQSEQEEFEAALPEGSFAVKGENVLELGERLTGMEEQKVNPGYGRVGFKEKAPEQRQEVYSDILDEYSLNLDTFLKPTPHLEEGRYFDRGQWDTAHQDAANARAQIAKENFEREQKRNLTSEGDFFGAATGGIASLKNK